jgi:hypothetical protein
MDEAALLPRILPSGSMRLRDGARELADLVNMRHARPDRDAGGQ